MKTLRSALFLILQLTWGSIQTISGALLFLRYLRRPHFFYHGVVYTAWEREDGVSLGLFTFSKPKHCSLSVTKDGKTRISGVDRSMLEDDRIVRHEFGHSIQSALLGPLYVFLIGVPSLWWSRSESAVRTRSEQKRSYWSFYTERWADACAERFLAKKKRPDDRSEGGRRPGKEP